MARKTKRNIWPFTDPRLSARRTTPARGGISSHTAPRGGARTPFKATSYRGYRLWSDREGGVRASVDPESVFDSPKDAKRFIDSWLKGRANPSVAELKAQFPAKWKQIKERHGYFGGSRDAEDTLAQWYEHEVMRGLRGGKKRKNPGAPGSAFKRCVKAVSEKGSAYDPNAVCASQGRKKYGAKKYAALARAGKKRKARENPAVEYKGHLIEPLPHGGYYVSTMPRRGNNEYGWRYLDSAKKWLDGKLKRNPADAAAAVYEEFHGMPSTRVTEVVERVHVHGHLAELGRLELLVVAGVDGYEHRISGFKGAMLCANETKDQLFIRGGDQKVNLDDFGISKPHEIETLGQVTEVQYFTDKKHLGSEGGRALYFHKHKHGPDLIYRRRDKALEFSGGEYEIKAEGIDK